MIKCACEYTPIKTQQWNVNQGNCNSRKINLSLKFFIIESSNSLKIYNHTRPQHIEAFGLFEMLGWGEKNVIRTGDILRLKLGKGRGCLFCFFSTPFSVFFIQTQAQPIDRPLQTLPNVINEIKEDPCSKKIPKTAPSL